MLLPGVRGGARRREGASVSRQAIPLGDTKGDEESLMLGWLGWLAIARIHLASSDQAEPLGHLFPGVSFTTSHSMALTRDSAPRTQTVLKCVCGRKRSRKVPHSPPVMTPAPPTSLSRSTSTLSNAEALTCSNLLRQTLAAALAKARQVPADVCFLFPVAAYSFLNSYSG